MTDRWAAIVAVVSLIAALTSPAVPVVAAALLGTIAMYLARASTRAQTLILLVAVGAIVGGRSHDSSESLVAPLPTRVEGVAELVSDPELQLFGTQCTIRIDGRRYLATVALEDSSVLRPLLTGDRILVSGRPRPLQGAPLGWVRSRHLAGRLDLDQVSPVPGTAPWFRLANAAHRTLAAGAGSLGEPGASLYTGLVMGDDRGQSDLMQFRFQAAGLSHLLAVSGQNVAFLLAAAAPVLRRLSSRLRVVAGVVLLGLFTLVTRGEPSVLRAAMMAGIALVAISSGRVAPGVRVLSLTVMSLLLIDPLLVHSIGFRLSISATAGLLLFTRPVADRLPGPDWLTLPLAVTLVAQAATAPVLVGLAGGVPAAATPANLLAVPAAGLVMMLGVSIGAVAGLARESIAQVLQLPAGLLVHWIEWVASAASRAPLPLLGPVRLAVLGLGVALLLGRQQARGRAMSAGVMIGAAVCAVVALWPTTPHTGRHELVAGATLWVGHCGGHVVALGPVDDPGGLLEDLWAAGVRRIDVVAVDASISGQRAALLVDEQFTVRRIVTTAERAPPGVDPLGTGSVSVGGLRIIAVTGTRGGTVGGSRSADRARVGVSEAACSF